ncbi:conserved hypothetical protein [Perkinsus marinus ATCC 50983]|uniref:DJ-1/PfpI domain-containing protein n=1 Tax=Perkinsus marinus (strain ATCC 50983 / TXsc) TaxID=423536 RepID=C5KAV9_PERM5|nr:conserved hypothetical protein [Perkinsus marinus ATCC 50983]EER18285.1 conserved hypothetical protein [Perkinsus marinus ATCC 50983]|eukprot:XP_002786489.1 conserved hypothetical protein [Perkinsus marinus ATCC 50983]
MPSALVAVANGSEEIEFNATVDVLARGGCDVTVACPGHDCNVKLSRGVCVMADMTLEQASGMQFDMIACPGGMPGAKHLGSDAFLSKMLKNQHKKGKWVAAICASPAVVLAPNGILDDVEQCTCYDAPVFRDVIVKKLSPERVVVSNKVSSPPNWPHLSCISFVQVITSIGPGSAIEFGLECVAQLQGRDKAVSVAKALLVTPDVVQRLQAAGKN